MGKGFNNYMCKKFFHPSSADNLKRVWMATKKDEAEKAKQADLRAQYDKEQELYQNKALLSKESKDKLEVNFMYEPPPGCKKVGEGNNDEDGEPEYKFEWQRTWGHAPKESYLAQGDDYVEQPFGIQVCQAKCIKCGEYGHMNIDKRCKLYGKAVDADAPIQNVDQDKLMEQMRADGLAMRWSAWDMKKGGAGGAEHNMVQDAEQEKKPAVPDRAEVLKNMSKEEKKKLLKKLKKMEKKKNKKSKKEKKKKYSDDSEDDSNSDSGKDKGRRSGSRDRGGNGFKRNVGRKEEEDNREGRGRRERSLERGRERSKSPERRRNRSRSQERRRERSRSQERRRDRSQERRRNRSRSGERSRNKERRTDRSGSKERGRERRRRDSSSE